MAIDIDKGFDHRDWHNWAVQRKQHEAAEERLKWMKEMLMTSDCSCKVVCLSVGLREDSGARLFKRKTGKTMVEWREQQRIKVD